MLIPRGKLEPHAVEPIGATRSPRYFRLQDDAGTIVSGWFESSDHVPNLKKEWLGTLAGDKKQGIPDPTDVAELAVGDWRAILYRIPTPTGSSTHIKAFYVRAGTWIDLHLSVSGEMDAAESRSRVLALLRSVTTLEK
jgi:hypothetical protein